MASIDGKALDSLRVVDLKDELGKRGLSKSGAKNVLIDRYKFFRGTVCMNPGSNLTKYVLAGCTEARFRHENLCD